MSFDIGLYGLAVMGQNFALNMADHGFSVCVGNRSYSKVEATVARAKEEGDLPLIGSTDAKTCAPNSASRVKLSFFDASSKPVG
jgi:6-phosphogluconate dehydrogenase